MIRAEDVTAAFDAGRGEATVSELLETVDEDEGDDEAVPHVHPDHPLGLALTRMGATRHSVLPVVSRADVRKMIGVVTLSDVLEAYGVSHGNGHPGRSPDE
jgi:CBS domain-containing protein